MDEIFRDLDAIPSTADDCLLSDDIWNPFHIDEMQLQSSLPFLDMVSRSMVCPENCVVENDCMWNGYCWSKEHGKRTSCNNEENTNSNPPGDNNKTPAVAQVPSQQSLLKPTVRMSVVNPNSVVPMTPTHHYSIQTPPISDDEESKPTQTLRNLETVINETIIENDDDLSVYLNGDDEDFGFFDDDIEEEDEDEEEEEDVNQKQVDQMRACYAAESDHSYHKGNHGGMLSTNLGIDTPSDSEEEIDVVSLGDKFNISSKSVAGALPTIPSTKVKRQLQRTMQNRFPQGIKTIMPVKRAAASSSAPGPSQTKNKMTDSRPAGRSRQYKRVNQNHRQYKRRCMYGHSSDSEQEPSEKRSLHNNMERQRRIDLRNLFNDLKKLVPEVSKKQRAAKVLILRGAAQYCRNLTNTNDVLERRVEFLRKQQARFRAELSQLRRNFAANR